MRKASAFDFGFSIDPCIASAMETSVPELNFSWSEFAEAGLFLSAQPDKNEACGTETSALSLNAPANSSFAEQNTSTQDRIAGQADSANSSELHTFEYGPRRLDLRTLLPGVARTHSLSQSQQSEHKQRHNASQKKQAANNSRVEEAIESQKTVNIRGSSKRGKR